MSIPAVAQPNPPARPPIAPLEPEPPKWVRDLFSRASGPPRLVASSSGEPFEIRASEPLVRVTTRISGAAALDARTLSSAVAARYGELIALLDSIGKHPIRYWNYVPGIVDRMDADIDRYMAFNRGRHAAYTGAWSTAESFQRAVPTASAIGITGRDLVIDCLCADRAGVPVENPRQISSWRYSKRYGPSPPCFARGCVTTLQDRPALLIAGTASIVGEESRHAGDARAQVGEIVSNLEALITNAAGIRPDPFQLLTDVRIYVVRADDAGLVEREIRARARPDLRIESAVARVCRPELLVEIEGVAAL